MILTITLNPSIDISYQMGQFGIGEVNRCQKVIKTAGGKGLNVTRVIHSAKRDVCATGFIGGTTGQFIKEELNRAAIGQAFVDINGDTRNCIAIIHNGQQTEILESGPNINAAEVEIFINQYRKLIEDVEIITASGSLPKGLDADYYAKLISIANEKGKMFILDTSGFSLKEGIKARPYLIKPNCDELGQLVNRQLHSISDIKSAILSLGIYEIDYIVVSMGAGGCLGYHNGNFYHVTPPKIHAINPVGSGDAMVGGLAIALAENLRPESVFVYGCAFGTLNAREEETGYIQADLIEEFVSQTKIVLLG